MLKFNNGWAAEIAKITTRPEFQNATVRIEDPSRIQPVQNAAGQWVYPEGQTPVVYEGRARVIGVRWGVSTGGEGRSNADTETAIRIQLPRTYSTSGAFTRIKKGAVVYVTGCEQNPVLEQFSFRVTSDMQGSSAASRTLEAELSSDVQVGNG